MESDMTTMLIFLILCGGATIILSGMSYGMIGRGSDANDRRKERRRRIKKWRKRRMKAKKERMASYVLRSNNLMASGNPGEAKKMLSNGMKYYSGKVIKAISPYASADAGLLSFALRTLANELEASQPGSRALREELERITEGALSKSTEKIQKPTAR